MASHSYQMDMCRGPLGGEIVTYSLPLLLTLILQLSFHTVDMIVIGQYAPHESLAAVGISGNIIGLVLSLFFGLSAGTNVVVAREFGAKNMHRVRQAVHCAMALAIGGGLLLMIVGELIARPILVLTGTPDNVLGEAHSYLGISFLAIPFIMVYHFGCSIMRAVGDTRRPLYFLIIAGIVHVVLNLFFVIVCGWRVAGVAAGTSISHALSAFLIVRALVNNRNACRLFLNRLKLEFHTCMEILRIGVPAGLSSSAFAVSNVTIQSAINSFGSFAMAGSTATLSLESLVYMGSGAYHQVAMTFVAQNYGGKQFDRIRRSLFICALYAVGSTVFFGWGFFLFGEPLLKLFTHDPEVVKWGLERMGIVFTTYAVCGLMDVATGGLRGLGWSMTATIASLTGACFFRIVWVLWILPWHRTFTMLLLSYPISWLLVAVFALGLLRWVWRHRIEPERRRAMTARR